MIDQAARVHPSARLLGRIACGEGAEIEAGALISHRVPFGEAPAAFALLDGGDPGVLQVLLTHS